MENSSINVFVSGLGKARLVTQEFYSRHTLEVARDLLGKLLVTTRVNPKKSGTPSEVEQTVGRIVETEAYRADDPASHSARGETPRCSIMFGEPGWAYVYLIYGLYPMLNFVTEPKGHPGAVLIRALEPLQGQSWMLKRRQGSKDFTRGPGKLAQAMGISLAHQGKSLCGPEIFVLDDGFSVPQVVCTPRIGITQGLDRLWRFTIADHPWVSGSRQKARQK
ncbi:MAG: DNA-3-methyladenine glycosylase [Bdellovibrionia bacterium]